ncbi:GGDEF domain-containing protein [Pseudoxanthomonas sp. PXM03]|uniref:sensor domain-containing phosphodiesterase n=1 Tax=Pseudoxanthomonas sp. PXM03 TaxID=2769284 RepID=UPI00177D33F7|nr:bifunctional diguanylate cyclase/phosphodiesterase [Pseudoxanthomonas sp. PXM03]MBD9436861.1 GGDEF domain-containing protein [Pseudoxanthomonas sp. PXM03]
MDTRPRAWWIDAGLVSLASLVLQSIEVGYGAHFFGERWQGGQASLLHAHAGLLMAIALLGGDWRVLAMAFLANFVQWWWRAQLQVPLSPLYIVAVAAAMMLQWRWTVACAGWAGGPMGRRRRMQVSGIGRYLIVCLLLFPIGWATLAAALYTLIGQGAPVVASASLQLLLAKHVGVGMLTLPFLLVWSDERLRQVPGHRWFVIVAWLCLVLVVGALLEHSSDGVVRPWLELVYEYRTLIGALMAIAMLLWRVEYSMPLLTVTHLLLLHALTDQAQQAESAVQMQRLLVHMVECNFMVLVLALLFLLNRERMERYRHVRKMGRHDASSGLANAHALQEAWRMLPATPPVMGFLLLDQVERVLGSYGWRAETLLLREAGRIMAPLARTFHLGGGHFVLLPRQPAGTGGETCAWDDILKRLQGHVFQWKDAQLRLNPYLGLVRPERLGAQSLDECLANACDAALCARREGECSPMHYVSTREGSAVLARQHRLVASAEALECVHAGRIELHLQPIVRIDGGATLSGFQGEVLCRLRTAQGRLLMPAEFIPDMEESGHVADLDIAVVECLFDWLKKHPDAMPGIARLGINLSGRSLASASFRARFADLLRCSPLNHHALCFELTETAVIASQDSALKLFQELRAHGCRLALDDFGSGVQNFERLKQVPVDSLKIDGQFIRHLDTEPGDLEIVRAAVAVAKAHGLATVAEYVENASQVLQLRALGVQWGQGYHLGRPRPIFDWLLPDSSLHAR